MTLSRRNQALLWRALFGLVIVECPVLTIALSQPVFEWRLLLIGLIGAAGGYLEKRNAPQLADTLLPGARTE